MERQGDDYLAIDVRDAQHTATGPPCSTRANRTGCHCRTSPVWRSGRGCGSCTPHSIIACTRLITTRTICGIPPMPTIIDVPRGWRTRLQAGARPRTPSRRRSRPAHVRPGPSRALTAGCPAGTVAGPGLCAPASARAGHRHAVYLRSGAGIARARRLCVAGSRRQRHSARPALARIAARRGHGPSPGRLVRPPAGRRPAAATPENTVRRSGVGPQEAMVGRG